MTKNKLIKFGFIMAAGMNIGGVLLFSRFFTNPVINELDPVVMSNFGLLMIVIWGLAYLASAFITSNIKSVSYTHLTLPTIYSV